jgi:hypothetical protein
MTSVKKVESGFCCKAAGCHDILQSQRLSLRPDDRAGEAAQRLVELDPAFRIH